MSPIASALAAFRSGKGLKGQLLRGGVGSVAIKIASTGLNLVLAIVLARALGAEGFGVYSFVFALITIMAIPAQMGLPNLVVRETAKAQAKGDWALMKGLWRWSTFMALAMSAALIAIGALAAWLFASQLPEGGLTVFYWGLVLVPLIALGNLRGAALRGLRHVIQGQLPEFILRPGFLILLVLAMHFGLSARALAASDAMMLHAVASLVAFAIGALMLVKARPDGLTSKTIPTGNLGSHQKSWLFSALPLAVVEGGHAINQNIGQIFIGFSAADSEVGFLRLGFQIGAFVAFGVLATDAVVAPHIARLHATQQIQRLRQLTRYASAFSTLIAILVFCILVCTGPSIITTLFGSGFEGVYQVAIVISIAQIVNAGTGPAGIFLMMCDDERFVLITVLLAAVANVIILCTAAGGLGALGAAIAFSMAWAGWNIVLAARTWINYGINCTVIPFDAGHVK